MFPNGMFQVFFALIVTLKNAYNAPLAQYLRSKLVDSNNVYFCEKCGKKRNGEKRLCIKVLRPNL